MLVTLCAFCDGVEVYLKDILIYVTHDRFVPPTVYFDCKGDDRQPVYLSSPDGGPLEVNTLYRFGDESVALFHVEPSQCRTECGVYDADLLDSDDLFGATFDVCEADFQAGELAVAQPGEFELHLACKLCNVQPPPPPPTLPPLPPTPSPDPPATSTASLPSSDSSRSRRGGKGVFVAAIVSAVLLVGFLVGIAAHKVYRHWLDEQAEESRRRFHALFADPATDIDELVAMEAADKRGFALVAHNIRRWWLRRRGYQPGEETRPSRQVVIDHPPARGDPEQGP